MVRIVATGGTPTREEPNAFKLGASLANIRASRSDIASRKTAQELQEDTELGERLRAQARRERGETVETPESPEENAILSGAASALGGGGGIIETAASVADVAESAFEDVERKRAKPKLSPTEQFLEDNPTIAARQIRTGKLKLSDFIPSAEAQEKRQEAKDAALAKRFGRQVGEGSIGVLLRDRRQKLAEMEANGINISKLSLTEVRRIEDDLISEGLKSGRLFKPPREKDVKMKFLMGADNRVQAFNLADVDNAREYKQAIADGSRPISEANIKQTGQANWDEKLTRGYRKDYQGSASYAQAEKTGVLEGNLNAIRNAKTAAAGAVILNSLIQSTEFRNSVVRDAEILRQSNPGIRSTAIRLFNKQIRGEPLTDSEQKEMLDVFDKIVKANRKKFEIYRAGQVEFFMKIGGYDRETAEQILDRPFSEVTPPDTTPTDKFKGQTDEQIQERINQLRGQSSVEATSALQSRSTEDIQERIRQLRGQ